MPKRIILLSDGTNNQGGLGRDTNVWRLFQMLNTNDKEQFSFYDDGVGTESSMPKRLMGLAFGAGLSRNVKELYTSLANHYEKGADIYLFGFSRGAFTVRLLANLIDYVGLPNGLTENDGIDWKSKPHDLDQWVTEALSDYKHKVNDISGDYCHKNIDGLRRWQLDKNNKDLKRVAGMEVKIRCMGVWDSVNATGMPVDEMRDLLLPRWVQDESIQELPRCVKTGFHALAVDEARKTFSPTLWDENHLESDQYVEQVWFAGVHSNVGGGYPKDGMAHVSLEWMLSRIEKLNQLERDNFNHDLLSFNAQRSLLNSKANVHDKFYDSRFGLGAFYRYQPRDIHAVTQASSDNEIPVIHESVFERIHNATEFYAPFMIRHFRIMNNNVGRLSEISAVQTVTTEHKAGDSHGDIWKYIRARVALYWIFFITSISFVAIPLIDKWVQITSGVNELPYVSVVIKKTQSVLPDFTSLWVDWYAGQPFILIGFLLLFVFQRMVMKKNLEHRLSIVASDLWHNLNKGFLDNLFQGKAPNDSNEPELKKRNVGELNMVVNGLNSVKGYFGNRSRHQSNEGNG